MAHSTGGNAGVHEGRVDIASKPAIVESTTMSTSPDSLAPRPLSRLAKG